MKKLLSVAILVLFALPCLAPAQTTTASMFVSVVPMAYAINYEGLAAFTGCNEGDKACSMSVSLCDETGKCLTYPASAATKHTFVMVFTRSGGATRNLTTGVAEAVIQIAAQ